ncbi:MAG TPA: imidazole glycerol phosphate synthase subunit HisH [Deltaproteobacteria bacterium]|jgi:glutamine amidotransferase|nr:imidazole glycerol phosphate synthase subunit HisH [Deltaproteobacteria bacterium]
MIAIVDYGMGNLRSVGNAFARLNAEAIVTRDADQIKRSSAIVLPGVGAFGRCVENLQKFDLFDLIKQEISSGKRYLGICLGMQILFETSEEAPGVAGMGVIKGNVARFRGGLKVPHMGWNSVQMVKDSEILRGIDDGAYFYFVHSFYPAPIEDVAATRTDYGIGFVSAVERDNLFACQFHPEKSQSIGLQLLSNFVGLCA